MINGEKVGVGVITGFRETLYHKCLISIPDAWVDSIVVINDNPEVSWEPIFAWHTLVNHDTNLGVGKSKNEALRFLLEQDCDHIFLIEEDIFIKDPTVFEKFINASKVSGIQHFNYSQHGMMNKVPYTETPNPRFTVDYSGIQVSFYPHCVGAFSYYSRKCLDTVGLIDEQYFNACEHVDHTYQIIKEGMHPPFWWFADLEGANKLLGDEPWSMAKSSISSNPNHPQMVRDADEVFVKKNGCLPGQIPDTIISKVGKTLKEIKNVYGIDPSDL